MDPDAPRADTGFTLLELAVALTVSGLILLGLQALVAVVGDTTRRIVVDVPQETARRNLEAMTRDFFLQINTTVGEGATFLGERDSLAFRSRCPAGGGWSETCLVVLRIVREDSATGVRISWPGEEYELFRAPGTILLEYLRDPTGMGVWIPRWGIAHSPPLAVRLAGGTLEYLFRIGDAG